MFFTCLEHIKITATPTTLRSSILMKNIAVLIYHNYTETLDGDIIISLPLKCIKINAFPTIQSSVLYC